MQVQVVSIVAYVGALLGIVLMYVWYVPTTSCKLNILFITVTLVLVQLMTFISVNSKVISYKEKRSLRNEMPSQFHGETNRILICWKYQVKAGYLAPGLMGIYVVFLCWSAIRR
jgi:hypothetical protein